MPLIVIGDTVKAEKPEPLAPAKSFQDVRQVIESQQAAKSVRAQVERFETKKVGSYKAKSAATYQQDMTTVHKV
jgi:hypothetical protein